MEIYEGFITDILVTLVEFNNTKNKRYFTNNYPTSLLAYNRYDKNLLFEKYKNGDKNKNTIQLTDVLDYQHKMGRNFVPSNQEINFTRDDLTNNVTLKTNLNAFLDVRVYSDFLGLINETPNGIVNFEASSKIFLNPRNSKKTHIFKSVTPFFKYSRFDNDDRRIGVNSSSGMVLRKLDLAQKAYIQAGAEFDVFDYKFSKEFPFTLRVPVSFQMNISELDSIPLGETKNLKSNTLVWGSGIYADMKRTKNFGLTIGLSYEQYDQKGNSDEITPFGNFNTIGANAELYYFNSEEDKSSAFYLRMQTKRVTGNVAQNFVSIQFGYKTSLNLSSSKSESEKNINTE